MRLPALIAVVLAGVGLCAGVALADAELEHLVILLRPSEVDELTREALSRITGELAAARFRVIIFPMDAGIDPIEQVDSVGGDLAPVAAFALVRVPDQEAAHVELWISDRVAHRTTIQRMRVQGGDASRAARLLAVESVELIRVSLADLWPKPKPPPPPEQPPPVEPPPPEAQASLAVGVGALQELRDTAVLWSPIAKLAYEWPGGLSMFAAARGLGPGIDLAETDGTARVVRAAGWLGVGWAFRPGSVLRPMLSLGGGVEYLRAEGSALDAGRAHLRTSWSGLAVAGGGLVVDMVPHVALVLEVDAMAFWPPVVVRIGETDAARFDRPSVMFDASLRASF